MWFTKTSDSFRGWFQVITSTGVLRTGIPSGSFTTLIIAPTDMSHVSASVTQSLQKQGVYYFDVPSSFLTSSGPGEYGVSVEVNIETAPRIAAAFSDILRVSYQDFDTIVSASLSASLSSSFSISQNSIDTIISGVWNVSTTSLKNPETMGYYQITPIVSISASFSVSVDVPSIVSGVWNANTASFTQANTFGQTVGTMSASFTQLSQSIFAISTEINSISGALNTLTPEAIAGAVWDEDTFVHSISGSTGLALQQIETRVHEIYQILGLQIGAPMTVSQTLRVVGAISQSLAGDPTLSVTVTRL